MMNMTSSGPGGQQPSMKRHIMGPSHLPRSCILAGGGTIPNAQTSGAEDTLSLHLLHWQRRWRVLAVCATNRNKIIVLSPSATEQLNMEIPGHKDPAFRWKEAVRQVQAAAGSAPGLAQWGVYISEIT